MHHDDERPMTPRRGRTQGALAPVALIAALLLAAGPAWGTAVPGKAGAAKTPERVSGGDDTPVPGGKPAKKDLTLEGGTPGTVFHTLTVEGEDRIHLDIQRPALKLDLDPASAPGLDLGGAADVLDRTVPDLDRALLDAVPQTPSERTARTWLDGYETGPVARFRPDVTDVATWTLTVTDARGRTAARFQGKGRPPKEIDWDGRDPQGAAAVPGLTYSYVLEARDRAGNKRHFVGDGFEVPAYRVMDDDQVLLALPGAGLGESAGRFGETARVDARIVEAATWVNQMPATAKVEITATARTHARADALARAVHEGMRPYLVGDPVRVREQVVVEADAPGDGAVRIRAGR